MDPRAAKGIAANIRIIAEKSAAVTTMMEFGRQGVPYAPARRDKMIADIDKAEANIAQWLQQPMTFHDKG